MKITIVKTKKCGTPQLTIKQRVIDMVEKMEQLAMNNELFMSDTQDGGDEIAARGEAALAMTKDVEIRCSEMFEDALQNRNNPAYWEEQKKFMRDFSEIDAEAGSVKAWGPKITLEEIEGRDVYLWGFKLAPSVKKQGTECLTMLLEIIESGEKFVLFTGSTVLTKLCLRYEKTVPFKTQISKVKNYYVFG